MRLLDSYFFLKCAMLQACNCLRLILVLAVLSPSALARSNASTGHITRELKSFVSVTSFDNLTEAIARAKDGDNIAIVVPYLTLNASIVIEKRIKLYGYSKENKTIIKCSISPTDEQQSAFILKNPGTILENFEVTGCSGPAISIIPELQTPSDFVLRSMVFSENFHLEKGGALYISDINSATFAVLIDDCSFSNNHAESGGAIYSTTQNVTVSDCNFEHNTAESAGGAIVVIGSDFTIYNELNSSFIVRGSVFLDNLASPSGILALSVTTELGLQIERSRSLEFTSPQISGGAIFAQAIPIYIYNSTFLSNMASAGGALFFKDNSYIYLESCTFRNNSAKALPEATQVEQGGAVYINTMQEHSIITSNGCVFESNSARFGGAFHLLSHTDSALFVSDCIFTQNLAETGGAVILRNTGYASWKHCEFSHNAALYGGAVFLTNAAASEFHSGYVENTSCVFKNNMAVDGGAFYCFGSGPVQLDDVRAIDNIAIRSGGAISIINSAQVTEIQDGEYTKNQALFGGAVNIDSAAIFYVRHNAFRNETALFRENMAFSGGALHVMARNTDNNDLALWHAKFLNNIADSNFSKNLSIIFSNALSNLYLKVKFLELIQSKDISIDNLDTTEDAIAGSGGAIWLYLNDIPQKALASYKIISCDFEQNRAVLGGGIYISSERDNWKANCDSEEDDPLNYKRCRSLSLTSTRFSANLALGAGGSLFITNPAQVYTYCPITEYYYTLPNEDYVALAKSQLKDSNPCQHWTGQVVQSNNSYGPVVASPAEELAIEEIEETMLGHTSGQKLPPIKLVVKDSFGQVIKGGIEDAEMLVYVRSDIIKGQTEATAKGGVVVFDSMVATGIPNQYTLLFSAKYLKSVNTEFSLRDCYSGEQIICPGKNICHFGYQTGCQTCKAEFYSLTPNIPCAPCPTNAYCPGGSAAMPIKGYWHSNPFSPYIHQCLSKDACSYIGRQEILGNFFKSTQQLSLSNYSQETYNQCNSGYKGILCGSCDSGYTRSGNSLCEKCGMSRRMTVTVISGIMFWSLIFVIITIRGAVAIARDTEYLEPEEIEKSQNNINDSAKANFTCKSNDILFEYSPYLKSPSPFDATRKQYNFEKVKVEDSKKFCKGMIKQSPMITASGDISESVKILVNFLQVTSIAVTLRVEWMGFIRKLLELQDAIAGFSNGSGVISFGCLANGSSGTPSSVLSLILRVAMPFSLLFIVVAFYICYWIIRNIRLNASKSISYLKSRCIICILCVLFLTYGILSKDFMRTLNCITVDKPIPQDLYSAYATATDRYWGEDTELKCFEGVHAILVFSIGFPGLLLISIGAPVYLALFLYTNKKKLFEDKEFAKTYGFVYMAYKEDHIYWEALIMLRKALVIAIVVFAYPLGGNLQGILALGVVLLALVLQMVIQPYNNNRFNNLEAVSLVVSALTFYFGVVFNDPNTTVATKAICSVVLFLVIVTFIAVSIRETYLCLDLYLYAFLDHLNVRGASKEWDLITKVKQIALSQVKIPEIENKITAIGSMIRTKVPDMVYFFSKRVSSLKNDIDQA